jgi:hypothetical protein
LIGAICPEPELLILDEPTSGLDPIVRREFIETVIGAYQEGAPGKRTILVSTHLITEFDTHHYIPLMQAMEYERDRRFVGRRKGRYGCMTGMAAMYRVRALYDVKAHYGAFYDQDNWTEDWFLTIALKHLGGARWSQTHGCHGAGADPARRCSRRRS